MADRAAAALSMATVGSLSPAMVSRAMTVGGSGCISAVWGMLPVIILLSSVVGAIVGISLIVFAKRGRDKPIPFGPYLAAAGLIALLYGSGISAGLQSVVTG